MADHLAESAKGGAYEETVNKGAVGMHKQYKSKACDPGN
ncbi:hypothetical protein B506_08169 [Lactobacillus delbrueckii subsp. jakobsenii ZN7a-9 = DSM 26046]|nr:hypothetical protein B506_08169 [Lactobacillus delbrueckii subsp. jakobsenii ZN7a-9 = DSM 26046]